MTRTPQGTAAARSAELTLYEVKRGGRSPGSTSAVVAFDGDLETVWETETSSPLRSGYVYADLREVKPVGLIRYSFATNEGADAVRIEISTESLRTQKRASG